MLIKKVFFITALLIASLTASAQVSVSPFTGFASNSEMALVFSGGDVIVGDFSNEAMSLTGLPVIGDLIPTSNDVESILPTKFSLGQNYPNPFNPTTNITYDVPVASNILLEVYNTLGMKVATLVNGNKAAGSYTAQFNARNLASGLYFYVLRTDGQVFPAKKMMLIK